MEVAMSDFTSRSGSFASPQYSFWDAFSPGRVVPDYMSNTAESNAAARSVVQSYFSNAHPAVQSVLNSAQTVVSGAVDDLKSAFANPAMQSIVSSGSGSSVPVTLVPSGSGTVTPVSSYLNADLAKAYGMDNSTAYQEALSNTSYQRAVADLQAAGINPALLTGNFSGAGGVVYASDGLSSGVSSASGLHDWYKSMSPIGSIIGGLIGYRTGGLRGAATGSLAGSRILGSIGNLLDSATK